MAKLNTELIINLAIIYIANINKNLMNFKSDVSANFIYVLNDRVIIIMNKPANVSNLTTIKKYIKNIKNINLDSIESPQLPKSKSYLKTVRLPHKIKQGLTFSEIIEGVFKELHLFKGVVLVSKLYIIKTSLKFNMVVVWLDIWDSQSGSVVKNIINH